MNNKEAMPLKQEIIDIYLSNITDSIYSRRMRKSSLNYFFEKDYFNYSGNVFEIDTQVLLDYHAYLKSKNITVQTQKNKWNVLASFLNYTMEYYYKYDFLVKIPKKTINWRGTNGNGEKKVKELIKKTDLERLLMYFKFRNTKHYLIFRLFAETGMRKSELRNIKISDVDIEKRTIKSFGKTEDVVYYFTKDTSKFLRQYLSGRKKVEINSDILFLTKYFKKYSDRSFNLLLKEACEKLGIKSHITCHTFRWTINTYRKLMGCSGEDRKILLNHKVQGVNVQNYLILDYSIYIRMYDKFNPYIELNY